MNHVTIMQDLINRNNYKGYLEIGVEQRFCFDKIECEYKIGIDPDPNSRVLCITSDNFFKWNKETFDIIFVDGLHHSEQTIRDINNALACLNDNGTIVVHDCLPTNELEQLRPRRQAVWTGDVWKAWMYLRRRADLSMYVIDCDYGCGIIKKGSQVPLIIENPTYNELVNNKVQWLNLVEAVND